MLSPVVASQSPDELLRAAGLRVTGPRRAVLQTLAVGSHLDADTIAREVRDAIGSVSTQTIYDVLTALTSAGLVRRIEPAGLPALFERRVADNHHHLVCRSCRRIVDIDCLVGAAPCLTPPEPHRPVGREPDPGGFTVDEAEVIFWGLCPQCRAQTEPPQGASGPSGNPLSPHPGAASRRGISTPNKKE